jgi:predicted DNA-binding transcriptional regulator YafY
MADKMRNGARLLYLRDYLLKYTDKSHKVKIDEILEYFETNIESVDRKSIYYHFNILKDYGDKGLGLGIKVNYNRNIKNPAERGFYIEQREFTIDELQLIVESIQASKLITQKQADELTNKLKKFANVYDRDTLNRRSYVEKRIRNENENDKIFKQVGIIHECIYKKKKLSFKYYKYNAEQKRVPYSKTNEIYKVNPFALLWNDGYYYLFAYRGKQKRQYRVDRMDDIEILDEKREHEDLFNALNIDRMATSLFSMFGGKNERVQLRVDNELAGVIIDRFGLDNRFFDKNENNFTVSVEVETSPQFYGWLCGFGNKIKIVAPSRVVEKMREYVMKVAEMYETDNKDVEK